MKKHNNDILFKNFRNPQGEGRQKASYSTHRQQINTNPKRYQGQSATIYYGYGKQQSIITNLRSQLTNLKQEVAKIMQKDPIPVIVQDPLDKLSRVKSNTTKYTQRSPVRTDSIYQKNIQEKINEEMKNGYYNKESQKNKVPSYNIYNQIQKLRNDLKSSIQRQKQLLNDKARLLQTLEIERNKQTQYENKKMQISDLKDRDEELIRKMNENEQLIGKFKKNQQKLNQQIENLRNRLHQKQKDYENLEMEFKRLQSAKQKVKSREKELLMSVKNNQFKIQQLTIALKSSQKFKRIENDYGVLVEKYEQIKQKLNSEQILTTKLTKKVQQLERKNYHRSRSKDYNIPKSPNSKLKQEDQYKNQLKHKDKMIASLLIDKKQLENELKHFNIKKSQNQQLNVLTGALTEQIIKLRISTLENKYINL